MGDAGALTGVLVVVGVVALVLAGLLGLAVVSLRRTAADRAMRGASMERRLAAVLATDRDGVLVHSTGGEVLQVNEAAAHLVDVMPTTPARSRSGSVLMSRPGALGGSAPRGIRKEWEPGPRRPFPGRRARVQAPSPRCTSTRCPPLPLAPHELAISAGSAASLLVTGRTGERSAAARVVPRPWRVIAGHRDTATRRHGDTAGPGRPGSVLGTRDAMAQDHDPIPHGLAIEGWSIDPAAGAAPDGR